MPDNINDDYKWNDKDLEKKDRNQTTNYISKKSENGQYNKNILELKEILKEFINDLKTYTDAKGWVSISKGPVFFNRYSNYYDINNTITTAGPINPNDFDSPVYNVERVFESIDRYAEIIHVINDGTDDLFVIVSHGGRTNFSQETPIFPGEVKQYYNVYELRLRSPTAGLPYRVTEYFLMDVSETPLIPTEVATIHNQPLPVANTNWLSTDITPVRIPTTFRIQVSVSIAGTFSAAITNGGNTQVLNFNAVAGPALISGGQYIFELLVHQGDTVNFRYSTTGGTIQVLRVQEIDAALA